MSSSGHVDTLSGHYPEGEAEASMARPSNEKVRRAIFGACGMLGERPTSTQVIAELDKLGIDVGVTDRQVRRYLDDWWELSEGERNEYRAVRWPDTFGAILPWESAPVVLPFLARFLARGRRPTVRVARWYYQVTVSSPSTPDEDRERWARGLALADHAPPKARDAMRARAERLVLGGSPDDENGPIAMGPLDHKLVETEYFGLEIPE